MPDKTTLEPRSYLIVRKLEEMQNMMNASMWENAYQKIYAYIQEKSIEQSGYASALYFDWQRTDGKMEFGIAIPVTGVTEVTDDELEIANTAGGTAYTGQVQGSYMNLPEAHQKLQQYCKDQHSKQKFLPIEEYKISGADTQDQQKWLTNVYYLQLS